MILSEEEKVEIENRFEEHVGRMIRLGSSFGREVPESAKSADLLLHIHFHLARLTSELRKEKIVNRGDEESRKEFIKESEECEGEPKQLARMVYARYGFKDVGQKWC